MGGVLRSKPGLGNDVVDRWVGPQGEVSGKCASSVLKNTHCIKGTELERWHVLRKFKSSTCNMTGHAKNLCL